MRSERKAQPLGSDPDDELIRKKCSKSYRLNINQDRLTRKNKKDQYWSEGCEIGNVARRRRIQVWNWILLLFAKEKRVFSFRGNNEIVDSIEKRALPSFLGRIPPFKQSWGNETKQGAKQRWMRAGPRSF